MQDSVTFSIIVPSSGGERRGNLERCVGSIIKQIEPGDELLVAVDHSSPWGYRARHEMMHKATGDFLLFMDDDDVYTPDAFQIIRKAASEAPDAIHIFRMDGENYIGCTVWHTRDLIQSGNVASQIMCIPSNIWLGAWGRHYEGDFAFLESTITLNPDIEVKFHDEIICKLRPE